ncbi:MAG: hypothetical protein ACK55Z_11615, partial [bacterium]
MQAPDLCQVKLGSQVLVPPRANRVELVAQDLFTAFWHYQHVVGIEAQGRCLHVRVDLRTRGDL